ncbi:hypothetical protein OAK35_02985 [Crocinitomicaceae bacterium]|nr:hypothetical protein [Crocinitomicaceae bacterium]
MERISIFNYEAFYLDYLEGNLSEQDTKMLLQFLEEHPECRMEDEDLVLLDDTTPMTFSGKKDLKQIDENGPVALDNVEHFMIADAEGLLTDEKKAELNSVVTNDQELEATRRRYSAVYYTADESVVYGGKAELKQRKALVLWPYVSGAVAAAAVVAIMLLTGGTNSGLGIIDIPQNQGFAQLRNAQKGQSTKDPKKDGPVKIIPATNNSNSSDVYVAQAGGNTSTSDRPVIRITPMERRANMQISSARSTGDEVAHARPLNLGEPIDWISPGTIQTFAPDMENPIEPITAFISDKAKTDVEFKRRKATEEKKGGFLLKFGKFEFSKNKH